MILTTLTSEIFFTVNPLDCRFPVVDINPPLDAVIVPPDIAPVLVIVPEPVVILLLFVLIVVHVKGPIVKLLIFEGVPLTFDIKFGFE